MIVWPQATPTRLHSDKYTGEVESLSQVVQIQQPVPEHQQNHGADCELWEKTAKELHPTGTLVRDIKYLECILLWVYSHGKNY